MAGFTLFPAQTAVKLTLRQPAAMIARMRTAVACVALVGLVAAAACNEGLSPAPACPRDVVGICGTATIRGTLPDSTQGLFIVAYTAFPESIQALLTFKPFPPPAVSLPPSGDSTVFYTLPLPSGRYEWVLAVWQKQGTLRADFSNADSLFREAGFYRDAGDTTPHGSGVVLVNGAVTDSIDFVIDFRNMHRICTYFPPCP
jgi:hypothetical protein